ncbi:hypothetical protein [Rhabdothermincola salaria]|uniref:hypothetical protein n=1 Tax=Rhabdothermincola salaria TaxID=2903142 RepID=UPI001E3A43D2|nr:hypothetical protein [Rhabdothermincola salaria]MCD9625267.1 hypothetical protein [Rhabdothermincola salaria]
MSALPKGLILYGPPATGKDTVTAILTEDPRIVHFRKLKAGAGRMEGYRRTEAAALDELERSGKLLSVVARYGNAYAIDWAEIERLEEAGLTPVVHTASLEEANALSARPGWRVCGLWASRRVTARRLRGRKDLDLPARLDLRSNMLRELATAPAEFDHFIDTDRLSASAVAKRVLAAPDRTSAARGVDDAVRDPDLVVAVPTLRDAYGDLDWEANADYAAAVRPGGVSVLVAGTAGQGARIAEPDRARLIDVWCDALGPARVVAGHLNGTVPGPVPGRPRPFVVPVEPGAYGLAQVGRALPDAVVYSRAESGWSLPIDAPEPGAIPFAVKFAGPGNRPVACREQLRWWHASTRTAAAALENDADAIVAASLAAAATLPLPRRWEDVLRLAASERADAGEGRRYDERVRKALER